MEDALQGAVPGVNITQSNSRALLYQTSRYVDIYKALDDIARERKLTP